MDKFTEAYIECALWAEMLDEYTITDFNLDSLNEIIEECQEFQELNKTDLAETDIRLSGHDFFLTRNRHGAGFWDRGLEDIGERLTTMAHTYGEQYLFIGDDDKVYIL